MNLRVIKLGGSVLATKKDKEKCVKRINLKSDEKTIIVVSAMGRIGFPYSTDSLSLLCNNVSINETDRMLSCGEIISSISFASFLNEKGYNSRALSYLEIGLNVSKNSDNKNVYSIDKYYYEKYFANYDILIVPGFIGVDENNEVVTLGRGNSDLTAILLAIYFNLKEVTLLKDVNGIYPFLIHPINKYKPYSIIDFENMEQLIDSGAKVVSKDAIIYAKNNNISIKILPYDNEGEGSLITSYRNDLKVVGFFVKQKTFDIITNYPCLIQEEMEELFFQKHLIVKNDYIKGNHYYFILDSSQLMYAKRLIIEKYFKNHII